MLKQLEKEAEEDEEIYDAWHLSSNFSTWGEGVFILSLPLWTLISTHDESLALRICVHMDRWNPGPVSGVAAPMGGPSATDKLQSSGKRS
jgi:hypothetical protein